MLRIAHVTGMVPRKYGGMERWMVAMAKECSARGHSFHMASEAPSQSPEFLQDFLSAGGHPVAIPARGRAIGFLWDISKWLRRNRIDVMHSHFNPASVLALLAGRITRVPLCVCSIHSGLLPREQQKFPLSSRIVAGARRMLCAEENYVSEEVLNQYRRLGLAGANARVNYLGVETSVPDVDPTEVRRELGLPPDDLIIICVAFHAPVKGVDVLLRAMPAVIKAFPKAKLVQIGRSADPGDTQKLHEQSRQMGLQDHVLWLGHRNDVPRLLACGDVYCQPSRAEGLPLAILEAMSRSLPVIASRVGGIHEAVIDGQTGLLVEPEKPADLASALIKVLQDAQMRRSMGLAGRQHVQDNFDITRRTRLQIDAYEKLIQSSTGCLRAQSPGPGNSQRCAPPEKESDPGADYGL